MEEGGKEGGKEEVQGDTRGDTRGDTVLVQVQRGVRRVSTYFFNSVADLKQDEAADEDTEEESSDGEEEESDREEIPYPWNPTARNSEMYMPTGDMHMYTALGD